MAKQNNMKGMNPAAGMTYQRVPWGNINVKGVKKPKITPTKPEFGNQPTRPASSQPKGTVFGANMAPKLKRSLAKKGLSRNYSQ